jgi:hypothetical protein
MYRSCSCLGYAATFFQPHLLQPEYYARERQEFRTATAKLLTCTLLKFSALNHMTVTLITRGLNPTSDFEARQYPHEDSSARQTCSWIIHINFTKAMHDQSHLCARDRI